MRDVSFAGAGLFFDSRLLGGLAPDLGLASSFSCRGGTLFSGDSFPFCTLLRSNAVGFSLCGSALGLLGLQPQFQFSALGGGLGFGLAAGGGIAFFLGTSFGSQGPGVCWLMRPPC